MNKKIMVACLLLVACLCSGFYLAARVIRTEEFVFDSDKCDNPWNPSRGLYVQLDSSEPEDIDKYCEEVSLFLLAYDLYEYRDCEISQEKLDELEQFLAYAQQKQVKCIFRPAYGFSEEESNDATSLALLQRHMEQFAPVINRYKAQIFCVQAGLFGPWGEWHNSRYLEGEDATENRCWLLEELTGLLDEEIVISVRRPRFIRDAVESGVDVTRLAYFDDGLLGSESDLGTYDDTRTRKEELQWVNETLSTGIMGGEMPYYNEYSTAAHADMEFDELNISYLNMKYNKEIYEQWKADSIAGQNAYAYIAARLGYRYRLTRIRCPKRAGDGIFLPNQQVSVWIANDGYANIAANYKAHLVIETQDGDMILIEQNQVDLHEYGTGMEYELSFPAELLKKYDVRRIGLCIYDSGCGQIGEKTCVQLVNEQLPYEEGINYLLYVDSEKNIVSW